MFWYHDEGEQFKPSRMEVLLFLIMIVFLFISVFLASVSTITIFIALFIIWMFMRSSRKDMKAAGALFGSIITGALFYILTNIDKIKAMIDWRK